MVLSASPTLIHLNDGVGKTRRRYALRQRNLDFVALDYHPADREPFKVLGINALPGGKIEYGVIGDTLDHAPGKDAFRQRAAIAGATILQGIECSGRVEDRDADTMYLDQLGATGLYV
jgi:hypothetical protein